MYSTFIAYVLWAVSGFGALGFHRFYLGKIPSGILWMFTGGLFGIGAIYDFFTLSGQVRTANMEKALLNNMNTMLHHATVKKNRPERAVLKLARENKGIVTISDAALDAGIPIEEAKKLLDAMVSKGFAELRVRKSGTIVYAIPDMIDKDEPLEDF
ncbi:MAG: NINE protein [Treponema sp.]|nr:NINE protein [Treponema sp.]